VFAAFVVDGSASEPCWEDGGARTSPSVGFGFLRALSLPDRCAGNSWVRVLECESCIDRDAVEADGGFELELSSCFVCAD